jgi:hypothetical protein
MVIGKGQESDLFVALKNAYTFNPVKDGIQTVAGNYIIMKCSNNVYAAFAHLKMGSIAVTVGQIVKKAIFWGKWGIQVIQLRHICTSSLWTVVIYSQQRVSHVLLRGMMNFKAENGKRYIMEFLQIRIESDLIDELAFLK